MKYMTIFALLSVSAMMYVVFLVARFIGSARFSLWHPLINGYVRNDRRCRRFVIENNGYYWAYMFMVLLIGVTLFMLTSISERSILNRPEVVLIATPFLWYSLRQFIYWLIKKI